MQVVPKKRFGQNFLKNIPYELLPDLSLNILQQDTLNIFYCVEIGPGTGKVSEKILERVKSFVENAQNNGFKIYTVFKMIEIDKDLVSFLQQRFSLGFPSTKVEIINSDVLQVSLSKMITKELEVIRDNLQPLNLLLWIGGSLPYNVSKQIIKWSIKQSADILEIFPTNRQDYVTSKLISEGNDTSQKPRIHLTLLPYNFLIQKEVAQNYVSVPPNADFLGTYIRLFTKEDPKILKIVPKGSFYPVPKVDGAILQIVLDSKELVEFEKRENLAKFIKQFYIYKRKTLQKIIKKHLKDKKLLKTIPETLLQKRPQEVGVREWENIYQRASFP